MIRSFQEIKNTSINLHCHRRNHRMQESREVVLHANTKQDSHESIFSLKRLLLLEAMLKASQSKLACKNILNVMLQVIYC